jgi:preprotein translocase subunit SecE
MVLENGSGLSIYIINMSKISQYLKETKIELKHVVWPSRRQTFYYTVLVIVISIAVAYYLGAFDSIFERGLDKVIGGGQI